MPFRYLSLMLALIGPFSAAGAATVSSCFAGACATLTIPDCVPADTPFDIDVEGLLEEGSGFSVNAYGLFENSTWHFDEGHRFFLDSGDSIDVDGFNWGDSLIRHYTLQRPAGHYRYSFVFGDRGFGHGDISDVVVEGEVEVGLCGGQAVPVDIKPGSCPNPINRDRNGVVSVALVGSSEFDVTTVDPTSVRLVGVAPLHFGYEDLSTPYLPLSDKTGELACHTLGSDGQLDLVLKFRSRDLIAALEAELGRPLQAWEVITATVTGELTAAAGGGGILGEDVIRITTQAGGRERR